MMVDLPIRKKRKRNSNVIRYKKFANANRYERKMKKKNSKSKRSKTSKNSHQTSQDQMKRIIVRTE